MIENHCVSLSMAKKLKEAGFKKETEFWWHYETEEYRTYRKGMLWEGKPNPSPDDYPAPLATELLEELPEGFKKSYYTYDDAYLDIIKTDKGFQVSYKEFDNEEKILSVKVNDNDSLFFEDKILPNAIAKMWLYLKANNLLNNNH